MTYISQIQNRIDTFEYDKVFIADDFSDIASNETVRRTLNRLVKEEKIIRIINGFYYAPEYSDFIKDYEDFDIYELIDAIARKYNWDIAPFGLACLNILSLSTQVPAKLIFVSNAKYKTFNINGMTIEFRKVNPREISNMSLKTRIVIQAIKELGKGNVKKYHIDRIKWRLTKTEKQNLIIEAKHTTKWIYEHIKEICKEKNE